MDHSELQITAELALMDLTEDEFRLLEAGVSRLLEYFSLMDGIDVGGLEATTHAFQEGNRLRPDVARADDETADAILEQAPDLEDRFIAIPNVL